jgi:hypothetical protein
MAGPFPNPAPGVSGSTISVDAYLRQPDYIRQTLEDLTLAGFFAEDIFTLGEDAPSGAVLYDQLTANFLYPDRDVQRHTPGGEFPIVIASNPVPSVASAEEYGGKFWMSYTAIGRNAVNELTRNERMLANALVKKWNTIAINLLNATVTAVGASAVVTGADWGTSTNDIFAQLAAVQFAAEQRELGIVLDTVIINPAQALDMLTSEKLRNLFTDETREQIVANGGLGRLKVLNYDIRSSFRQPAGTALVTAKGMVGGRHHEAPVATGGENIDFNPESGIAVQTWDDPAQTRRWAQAWKSQILYVDNPYAVYRLESI